MIKIYNAIKNDIKAHSSVKLSILGTVPEWKRSQYVILSDIITEQLSISPLFTSERKLNLGISISPITLQRFFENQYQVKTHNDLRFIKTLDKLCVFLGKFDLNTYIYERLNTTIDSVSSEPSDKHFFEKQMIFDFCKSQFEALRNLPLIDVDKISGIAGKESPLGERIRIYLEKKRKNKLRIVTENNRSNFEIFDVKKICDEADLKVIKTQEFWNLVFEDGKKNTYVLNHLNTQFYFLKKFNEQWKIWDNYNPDQDQILKIN